MIIREFRIILPISVEEYRIAQLWSVAQASKNETGGGEGVEIVINEPRDFEEGSGQFTMKILHLKSKAPGFLNALAPKGSIECIEETKNWYPYTSSTVTNPDVMKDNFYVDIKTWHKEDFGELDNVHEISTEEMKSRTVDFIDIVNDPLYPHDYKESEDPSKVVLNKSGRGPLSKNWIEELKSGKNSSMPHMCVYKLVKCEFRWFGLQDKVERMIMKFMRRMLLNFYRQVYCWMDNWSGLSLEGVRKVEEETRQELVKLRQSGVPKGMFEI